MGCFICGKDTEFVIDFKIGVFKNWNTFEKFYFCPECEVLQIGRIPKIDILYLKEDLKSFNNEIVFDDLIFIDNFLEKDDWSKLGIKQEAFFSVFAFVCFMQKYLGLYLHSLDIFKEPYKLVFKKEKPLISIDIFKIPFDRIKKSLENYDKIIKK